MHVVSVNLADRHGGAERVAVDLHRGFQAAGHRSTLVVGYHRSDEPGVVALGSGTGRAPRELAARLAWKLGFQGVVGFGGSHHLPARVGRPWDVLVVHGLHGNYFDLAALPDLSALAPTVLVQHDMMLLTGHCGHALDCDRFTTGCGKCPDLRRAPTVWIDRTRPTLRRKRRLTGRAGVAVAAPSRWMLDRVARSHLAWAPRRHHPNPVDLARFSPLARDEARRRLGLSADERLVLLPAPVDTGATYKGLSQALDAVRGLADLGAVLVAFGRSGPAPRGLRLVPPVADAAAMRHWYAAADAVVYPSTAENSPLAVLEAMACARPVLATSVGGIPELLVDGEEGYLVAVGDHRTLAGQLRRVLTDETLARRLGQQAARRVAGAHALDVVVGGWLAWFDELAAGGGGQPGS